MKVLYISGMYPTPTYPQKGIFCHEQVKALKQIGVDVDVIVPMTIYDKEYTTKNWIYEDVSIRYIKYFKFPGVRYFEKIGKYLYYALMRSKIDFSQYDVLHADAPLPAGDAIRRISQKYDIPFVVHGHGLDVFMDVDYQYARNCNKIVEKCIEVYEQCDAITGVSQKVVNNILSRIDVKQKCFVVYNGVDTKRFIPRCKKDNERLEIISVGNLIELKGHDITLKAMAKVIEQGYSKLHLTIYGRGDKEKELKNLVAELKIQKYVTFGGYISYDQIAEKMRRADLFVLPSWYEAVGCVYLESMASGTPVIGCRGNGIDEIIQDRKNSYLVRPHNIEDVIEIICYVYKHKADKEYEIMAENARKSVEKNFSWRCSAEHLLMIYKHLKEEK